MISSNLLLQPLPGQSESPVIADLHHGCTETLEEVNRVGRERLFPSLTNSSWLVLRARRRLFEKWLQSVKAERLSVLDVGGRIQPYRQLLAGREGKYVAVDVRRSPLVDIVAGADEIPLPDAQFDLAVCTQVLQYVQDPAKAIAEMFRLLKPGGYLLLSVPAAYPRDSAEECWRFLPQGLKVLLDSFSEVEIAAEGGTITGVFRTVAVWLTMFARPASMQAVARYTAVPLLNLSAAVLEPLAGKFNDQFAANYSVFARK